MSLWRDSGNGSKARSFLIRGGTACPSGPAADKINLSLSFLF